MNFQQLRENVYKKIADGYVMVWNHRKGRYDFIKKAQDSDKAILERAKK